MITKRQTSENANFHMFLSFCLLLLRLPALVGDAGVAAVMLHDSHWQSSCHTCETGVGLLSFSSRSSNGKEKSTCDRPSAVIQRVHSGKALLSEMCVHTAYLVRPTRSSYKPVIVDTRSNDVSDNWSAWSTANIYTKSMHESRHQQAIL